MLLGLVLGAPGFGPGCAREGDELLIASPWPETERAALASAFRRWVAAIPGASTGPVRIKWIPLSPGDDPTRVVRRRVAPDLVLGGGSADYRRLARGRWLIPIERSAHPLWCVSRRSRIGRANWVEPGTGQRGVHFDVSRRSPIWLARDPGAGRDPAGPKPDFLTLDDFRRDPIALAWAKGQLADGPWADGYARLVRFADHPRRIGRQAGAALAAVERGEAGSTPAPVPRTTVRPIRRGTLSYQVPEGAAEWVEGVAVVRGGNNPSLAQEFVRFLDDRGQAESPPADDPHDDLEAEALLADLLGATLVDAQDELWSAWARLEASGCPGRAEHWMTEPPPWPPASVARMLQRGEEGGALLETLTAEIAPEPDVRAWLLRSWLAPPRLIDGALLAELAGAVDGRLVREPRFRAWLRGEWTAWARQRYRRVARLAGAAVP